MVMSSTMSLVSPLRQFTIGSMASITEQCEEGVEELVIPNERRNMTFSKQHGISTLLPLMLTTIIYLWQDVAGLEGVMDVAKV